MTIGRMLFAALGLAFACGACSPLQRAETAAQAQTQMVGMSKKDLYLCAGVPVRQQTVEGLEFLTYSGGGDTTSTGIATGTGSSTAVASGSSHRRYCEVTFVLRDSVIEKVNYQGRTGGPASKGEQCAFVVERCVKP